MREPEVTAVSFTGEETLLYVVNDGQATIKSVNISTGDVDDVMRAENTVHKVVQAPGGVIYLEISASTPRNRSAHTIVVARPPDYKLEYLFEPAEIHRSGLTVVEGQPYYTKTSNYAGAFGGLPWQAPFVLAKYEARTEIILGEFGMLPPRGSFAGRNMLAMNGLDQEYNQVVTIIDTARSESFDLMPRQVASDGGFIESYSLAPDASRLLVLSSGFGHEIGDAQSGMHYALYLIDLESGTVVDSYITAQPVLAALYSPSGDIYFVEWSDDKGSALYKWEGRENTFVIQLK